MPAGATIALLAFYGNWYLTSHPFFSPAGYCGRFRSRSSSTLVRPGRCGFCRPASALVIAAVAARLVVEGNATSFATITRLDPIAIGIVGCLPRCTSGMEAASLPGSHLIWPVCFSSTGARKQRGRFFPKRLYKLRGAHRTNDRQAQAVSDVSPCVAKRPTPATRQSSSHAG